MSPEQQGSDRGDAVSTPRRDIFPFMLLPPEIRIQIYKLVTSSQVCVPTGSCLPSNHCRHCQLSSDQQANSVSLTPGVKALLQSKQIRHEILPYLHLAWVGGLEPPMVSCWESFKHTAIPSVSNLTIGVERLFCRRRIQIEKDPLELLRWMCRRSQPAPGRDWNLTHLTLIEGVYNWPSNPLHLLDVRGYSNPPRLLEAMGILADHLRPREDPKGARALVRGFPMISGLRSLRLVLAADPGQGLLKRLSEKCSAHGINFEFVVREPWLRPVPTKRPKRTPA